MWLHNVSDGAIWFSYMTIPLLLVYFVRRRPDIPFTKVFWMFGGFIVFCGLTHLMEVVVSMTPLYRLSGIVKLITAGFSVATAVALVPILPLALALRSPTELEKLNRELEREVGERKRAQAKLQATDELKNQLFANVSHELRTPLTLVLGPIARMLSGGDLPEACRRDMEVVQRNTRTLLKHVNDLLDVAKIEAGKMGVVYSRVDLACLVRETASLFDGIARERRIAYAVETPPCVPTPMDADKIRKVLFNLLANAFKFAPDEGRIFCRLEVIGERAILSVADSGSGVPPEHRESIFERFRQIDGGPSRRFGGTGLGLAIAKEFVELHGGSVRADRAPEGGALFVVELPLEAPAGASVGESIPVAADEQSIDFEAALGDLHLPCADPVEAAAPSDRPRVLVVEDNREMSRFIADTLALEFEVLTAADGEEGLQKAALHLPDLMLIDVMMPRMSGDELLRRVRSDPKLAAIPVIVLTAKADEKLRIRLLREGAEDFLMKPFHPEEVLARARNIVRLRKTVQELESANMALKREALEREKANGEARKATELAEAANRELESFNYSVSHDLRAPLRAIDGFSRAVVDSYTGQLEERAVHYLGRVRAATQTMDCLIDDLLDLSRISRSELGIERVDLSSMVAEICAEFRRAEPAREVDFAVAREAVVCGDPRLLRIALQNLLGNAWKFTKRHSRARIEFGMRKEAGESVFFIRDDGAGFDMKYSGKLFGAFQRLHSIEEFEGTGVGLATVQRVVMRHGGRIWAEGEVEKGATFYFTLGNRETRP